MKTLIVFSEVEDGEKWTNAWHHGEGGRHQMFDKIGVICRTFRDSDNPTSVGVIFEIPDMAAFDEFLQTDENKQAMAEDGLKIETMRTLHEVTA